MSTPVERFFQQTAYAVELADPYLATGPKDIIKIAEDPAQRAEFRRHFQGVNDPDRKVLIKEWLSDIHNELESTAERSEIRVEMVDRVVLTPAGGVAVAGIVALAGSAAVVVAAPFVLAGGLIGLVTGGLGRSVLKFRGQRNKALSRKVKQLKDSLQ